MEGYQAEGAANAQEAMELASHKPFDIVVTDVTMPGMSGLDLLPHLLRLRPGIIPIVITAYATIDVAVEAMKRGASDFLTKPFELDALLSTLRVAAERIINPEPLATGIIGRSKVMRELLDQVSKYAPLDMTVLITGETGTGKELIARAVHQQSKRRQGPLIALNCAAVPEQLLEDELFGHVKGAFTGAQAARKGRFEQANGGTLFLDEIGDMSVALQIKLLRALQEREFYKVGAESTTRVDVRIVAATSADLERRITEGKFREDLYYRLKEGDLHVPPLRERPEDIRPIAEHLLARFCESAGLPMKTLSEEVWPVLNAYYWPGNVRQLQNAVKRAAALSGTSPTIGLNDLPKEIQAGATSGVTPVLSTAANVAPPQPIPDEGVDYDAVVTQLERELLLRSLDKTGGNKKRAAELLKIKRTTFIEKLNRFQIQTKEDAS